MNDFFSYNDGEISIHYKQDRTPAPSDFKLHTHESYELFYFAGGSGIYRVEGTPYPLKEGDILIMRPSEAHYIDITKQIPYTRLSVHFQPNFLTQIHTDKQLLAPFCERKLGSFNYYDAESFDSDDYRLFIRRLMMPCSDRRLQTITNLLPLLYEIYNAFEKAKTGTLTRSLDSRIISYINRHIAEDLSLGRLCKEFSISESQLCRTFKKATASTVGEYITIKRLMKARELLVSGTPPTSAYLQCGFHDYSTFYRAYKKKYGASPTQHITQQESGKLLFTDEGCY